MSRFLRRYLKRPSLIVFPFLALCGSWSIDLIHQFISTVEIADAGEHDKFGGTYRRPLGHEPVTLDPARPNDIYGRTIAQQLYDGLVQYDSTLAIRPAIAASWRASRDGLVWTFYLRQGVKFHHGREVTAEDFVYSFARIVHPDTKSAGAPLFSKIKGAKDFINGRAKRVEGLEALDKYTLRVTLEEAEVPFVAIAAIAFAKVIPREIVEPLGDGFGKKPIGTGPFRFVSWTPQKEIVLEANRDYFEGRPYLDRIIYKFFPGEKVERVFQAFEDMQLEDSPLPAHIRKSILSDKRYLFIKRPMLGFRFLGLNSTTKPLDDRRVRQALTHAIDRKWIAENAYSDQYPSGVGILPPGTYGYDPLKEGLSYNPEKAKSLLAAAGYPNGKEFPTLQIWSSVNFAEAVAELEAIRQYLAAINVKAEIYYKTNWPEFKSDVYAGKFPIFRYSWYADTPDPDTFLSLFHSGNRDNLSRYKNTVVDKMLSEARSKLDYIKKVKRYQEIEDIIIKDAPIIVLGYYSYERVFHRYVQGVEVNALGDPYIPMKKIWIDKQKLEASLKRNKD